MTKTVQGLPDPINGFTYCELNTTYVIHKSYTNPKIVIGKPQFVRPNLKPWHQEEMKTMLATNKRVTK